ncbi:MAG: PCRF domain-containing protein [Patescibacteria group bacterium]|nr:PCRF domain-containing protein [Patescibacteria group bacterium]
MNGYLKEEIKRLEKKLEKAKNLLKDPQLKNLAQEEVTSLQSQLNSLKNIPSRDGILKKKTGKKQIHQGNAILEVRAAAGGEEAKIWANDLIEMYTRFAEIQKLEIIPLDSGIIKIKGKQAFPLYQFESGVHRVQRIPSTESSGRIHTSTATVTVLPEIKKTEITIKPKDVNIEFYRSSGSGGQNVNKVSTAVRLKHLPSNIVIESQTQRTQEQNRKIAFDLLRTKLFTIEKEKKIAATDSTRKKAVGRGMRAEKIRTYNFPQNRVTDHRIQKSFKDLKNIIQGNLLQIITALNHSPTSSSLTLN